MRKVQVKLKKIMDKTYIELPFNAREEFQQDKGRIYVRGKIEEKSFRSKVQAIAEVDYIVVDDDMFAYIDDMKTNEFFIGVEKEDVTSKKDIEIIDEIESGMDLFTAISTRRSIRKYTDKDIPESIIKQMINAACNSPSAHNMQPWQFVVIDDDQIKEEINEVGTYTKMANKANICILICGDKNLQPDERLLYADLGAATQSLLLAGHALGIGCVWCAANVEEKLITYFKEKLQLVDKIEPFGLIACGYPDESRSKQDRYHTTRVHYNKW